MATLPVQNPTVPFLALIPGGLRHGLMIRVKGHMSTHCDRFIINIQTGAALEPSDDKNLHLSIRPSERIIVRNHMANRNWGAEERNGGCPIVAGQSFEILILAETDSFKVAVNGTHFCQFTHRVPLARAQFFHMKGDGVTVQSTILEGDVPSAPPMHYVPPGGVPVFPPPINAPSHFPSPYVPGAYPQFPTYQPGPGAFPSVQLLRKEIKDEY